MIQNINEINRLLLAISELRGEKNIAVAKSAVIRQCKNIVIGGSLPNHGDTIDFCISLKIIKSDNNRLAVEHLGKLLLDANSSRYYEFTEDQKKLVARKFILNKEFLKDIYRIIASFSANEGLGTFVWSPTDGIPIEGGRDVLNLMLQLGILEKDDPKLFVNQRYVSIIANLKGFGMLSPEKLRKILDKKIEVGDITENLVVLFEKKRLKSVGAVNESKLVKKISDLDVSAGYDVQSFDTNSPDLKYDRFIEVKGSSSCLINFEWSRNEVETARKLGSKYWIYFWGGIDVKKKSTKEKPKMFKNPVKSVLENPDFEHDFSKISVRYRGKK